MAATKIWFVAPLIAGLMSAAGVAQPDSRTVAAFDKYVAQAELQIARRHATAAKFLSVQSLGGAQQDVTWSRLRRGEIVIEKAGDSPREVTGGLIHDWVGTVFIAGVNIEQVLATVEDHDHFARYYAPEVMDARIVSLKGDDRHVFMRLREHKVITVVLDTEYDIHYGRIDFAHQYADSRSTRVTEVVDSGAAKELPPREGRDHGFMWRLNSYWTFEQTPEGVFVECEAISLSRAIPVGLEWLIGPFVQNIPRESLQFTLTKTRDAVLKKAGRN